MLHKYTHMHIADKLLAEYFEFIKVHDYTYHYSEDMSVWRKWNNHEKRICELIHSLVAVIRYSAEELLSESVSAVPEQFTDGSNMTHHTIRKWFKDYI